MIVTIFFRIFKTLKNQLYYVLWISAKKNTEKKN